MRRRATRTAATVVVLALALAACNGVADVADVGENDEAEAVGFDETIDLTAVSYAIPGTDPLVMSEEWAERLEEKSGGRFQIDLHPGGTLIGYGEEREGLTEGVIDIALTAPMFFSGDDPGFAAWGLIPAAPITEPERARYFLKQWVEYGGGLELARELYEPFDLYPIGTVHKSHEPVMSTVPLRSLEDFQGLRIRAAPGLVAEVFAGVGAEPVSLPGGEIYTALDTGVVDAAEFVGAQENYGAGLHEVADYVLFPAFHSPSVVGDVTMRIEDWEALPRDLQLILEDSVRWLNERINYDMGVRDIEALERFETEYGIEVNSLSDEEYQEIKEIQLEVTRAWRDESEMAQRIIDSYLEFAERMGFLDVD
jgi:TRAP-type mannitol/chloroaromatic compound transport system substrate-binding protein